MPGSFWIGSYTVTTALTGKAGNRIIFPYLTPFIPHLLLPLQPQAVRHHTHAAQGHGRSGNHRVKQETTDGIEDPGSNRYADNVIDKRPEQVLTDGSDGLPRQTDCMGNPG